MNKIQFTLEGLEKLREEYEELKSVKHPKAVDRLSKARAMGDLSENSEYVAAKEDLDFLEGRLAELEHVLKNSYVSETNGHRSTVEIGNTIKLKIDNREETYHIVGEFEADPLKKKVSHTSPIGSALIGKKVGDTVTIEAPVGTLQYTIVEIS